MVLRVVVLLVVVLVVLVVVVVVVVSIFSVTRIGFLGAMVVVATLAFSSASSLFFLGLQTFLFPVLSPLSLVLPDLTFLELLGAWLTLIGFFWSQGGQKLVGALGPGARLALAGVVDLQVLAGAGTSVGEMAGLNVDVAGL